MTGFSYDTLPITIRPEIQQANREIWAHIASPGCWWTGQERVAMADEVRRAWSCTLCCRRKESLSPYGDDGRHDHGGLLPNTVVEAVHRIATDPGRLKKSWYDGLLQDGLTDAQYVEIVSVVVVTADEFHRALGLEPEPLPVPIAGKPSHYRPAGARQAGAWVPMILVDGAIGAEANIYSGSNRIVNVVSALSLVPEAIRMAGIILNAYYMPGAEMPDFSNNGGRALRRSQMEFIAARVSAFNDCFY